MSNEKYVNTPLSMALYEALRRRAQNNGRNLGREIGDIVRRALCRKQPSLDHKITKVSAR